MVSICFFSVFVCVFFFFSYHLLNISVLISNTFIRIPKHFTYVDVFPPHHNPRT